MCGFLTYQVRFHCLSFVNSLSGPVVDSIEPSEGAVGTIVTVHGENFLLADGSTNVNELHNVTIKYVPQIQIKYMYIYLLYKTAEFFATISPGLMQLCSQWQHPKEQVQIFPWLLLFKVAFPTTTYSSHICLQKSIQYSQTNVIPADV